jgi:hypothetical protein
MVSSLVSPAQQAPYENAGSRNEPAGQVQPCSQHSVRDMYMCMCKVHHAHDVHVVNRKKRGYIGVSSRQLVAAMSKWVLGAS